MTIRTALPITLVAVLLIAPPAGVDAQRAQTAAPNAGFNDPEFWRIVSAGPRDSAELEQLVTTYIANDRDDEAARHLADYLLRDPAAGDAYCSYCQSMVPSTHRFQPGRQLEALRDASETVLDHSFETGSATGLIRLAVIMAASDVREHRDLALYFLSAAAQIGIDDDSRDEVVRTLAQLGYYADALRLGQAVYQDARSTHFQSAELKPWISYLNLQVTRREQIVPAIAAAAMPR